MFHVISQLRLQDRLKADTSGSFTEYSSLRTDFSVIKKCDSDICVCVSAGNGQKFNKLLLSTLSISLNLLVSWELIAKRFYGISNWVSHPSMP